MGRVRRSQPLQEDNEPFYEKMVRLSGELFEETEK